MVRVGRLGLADWLRGWVGGWSRYFLAGPTAR
jgi:hypothetical protein